jgi:hypothetical protein
MLIADSFATRVILADVSDGRSRHALIMIDVKGRVLPTKLSRVSVATAVRSEKVRELASLSQSSVTQEPQTAVPSHSRPTISAVEMPNNCNGANGRKNIPKDRT